MNDSAISPDLLPLSEATFFILLTMAYEPKHGYAILKEVSDLSAGRVRLSTGTLYGALSRLLDQGWIERLESDQPTSSTRVRKEYQLTDLGRDILAAETRRLETVLSAARQRLSGVAE